jgi:uncharacterized protein (DUF1810 family)
VTRDDNDPFNLQRFVEAQNPVYSRALAELSKGRKTSHWMWFVFPQIEGLGASPMATKFAISSLDEATAYLAHPILGARLRDCVAVVNGVEGASVHDIFGAPDDRKFHSCVTLFHRAAPDDELFNEALRKYFNGKLDQATLARV